MNKLAALWHTFEQLCAKLPEDIVLVAGRMAMFSVFWRSVQTKITGWEVFGQSLQFFNISGSTVMLFQYEYQLALLSPTAAAYAGTFAEFFFALMLLFGLGTRLAALGLLGVTAVIQLLVFPEAWPTHILWLAILLYLLQHGGGRFALDNVLRGKAETLAQ
jgi:putative oxidoreductase